MVDERFEKIRELAGKLHLIEDRYGKLFKERVPIYGDGLIKYQREEMMRQYRLAIDPGTIIYLKLYDIGAWVLRCERDEKKIVPEIDYLFKEGNVEEAERLKDALFDLNLVIRDLKELGGWNMLPPNSTVNPRRAYRVTLNEEGKRKIRDGWGEGDYDIDGNRIARASRLNKVNSPVYRQIEEKIETVFSHYQSYNPIYLPFISHGRYKQSALSPERFFEAHYLLDVQDYSVEVTDENLGFAPRKGNK